jgi:hypothetical protein
MTLWFFKCLRLQWLKEINKKKVGGDLEVLNQIVVSWELIIGEQNVVPLQLGVNESNNPYGLELEMVVVYNSNDEISPDINWEFRSKSGGLNCFRIYIH